MGNSIWQHDNLAEVFEQEVSMASRHQSLMEVSRLIKDDLQAQQLLDNFLDACFDSVPPPAWAVATHWERTTNHTERIATALDALNAHLKQHILLSEGILPPSHLNLNDWAEEITMNVLTNYSF